jgi:oligopeptidase B
MLNRLPAAALGASLVLLACQPPAEKDTAVNITPPAAAVVPQQLELHGDVRTDNYYWLKDRDDPKVIAYLEEENRYTDALMAHTGPLQKTLFAEFKERIKQTDMSVPYRDRDYLYYSRTEEGKDYPVHCRRKAADRDLPDGVTAAAIAAAGGPDGKAGPDGAPEEILLDVNALAQGHDFYALGQREVSPGQDLIAYAEDPVGRRIYTVRVKNLKTGELLPDAIQHTAGNVAWANDNRTLFYTRQDETTLRPYRIYRHVLGTDPAGDALVYEEKDETFRVGIGKSKSRKYLIIGSFQTLSSEMRYLDAGNPAGEFRVFQERQKDHEYSIDHLGGEGPHSDRFYIRTNDSAKNFRLMSAAPGATARSQWKEVIPHRADVLLESFELFRDHLVVGERKDGLIRLHIVPWAGPDGDHYLDFGEPAYLAYISTNKETDTPLLRYTYQSMTTPDSVYDYDMVTLERTLLKRDEVLGGFDPDNYVTERLSAPARDGARVPISLVYRKGTPRDGSARLVLYAYGSYGFSMDASFSPYRISLLDRGLIWAIAHVRGGEELGRAWYEDGKLLDKKNTFTDFIDCAEHLIVAQYTGADRIYAMGGSAGGLLVGAVINMRPDLFDGALAQVPFVDVVTTMLDDSIPLTTNEYDEWGDPNDRTYYDYMKSYSPYDNVVPQEYPHLLVTTSLHDSQVQYFEPAKWVAKLRAVSTGDNRLLLKTEMEAGHGGVSGRDKRYREVAFEYAFLLDLAGVTR